VNVFAGICARVLTGAPTAVKTLEGVRVTKAVAGKTHTLFLTSGGEVCCLRLCACACACVRACVHVCVCSCVRVCVCVRARACVHASGCGCGCKGPGFDASEGVSGVSKWPHIHLYVSTYMHIYNQYTYRYVLMYKSDG